MDDNKTKIKKGNHGNLCETQIKVVYAYHLKSMDTDIDTRHGNKLRYGYDEEMVKIKHLYIWILDTQTTKAN